MIDLGLAMAAFAAGGLLGALFFGGLWWTVRNGIVAANPAIWFPISLLLRMAITLAGFYFVSTVSWPALLACVLGFLIAVPL